MTAPELKPCPFCGGGAEDDYMHDDDQCGGHGAVYCVEGCGAEVYGDTVRYRGQEPTKEAMQASKQSAIAAWNTRTPDPLLAEALEALRWYAEDGWKDRPLEPPTPEEIETFEGLILDFPMPEVTYDRGERARAVLAKMEGR